MFNLGGAMKNITDKAEHLLEEKKTAAASLLEKQVKESGEFLAHSISDAEVKADEAKKAAVDGFEKEVEKIADNAMQESSSSSNSGGGGLLGDLMQTIGQIASQIKSEKNDGHHTDLDLGSLIGGAVKDMIAPHVESKPAAEPGPPPTPASVSMHKAALDQAVAEAKTLVDKTTAELKPALGHVVQDKVNPLAQDIAKKLQPVTGDVSGHINTALAEGVKHLNPVVDDVSSKVKAFADDASKKVSGVVDEKLKEADGMLTEKREALGEPTKNLFSKAKGLFGCKLLGCCTIM